MPYKRQFGEETDLEISSATRVDCIINYTITIVRVECAGTKYINVIANEMPTKVSIFRMKIASTKGTHDSLHRVIYEYKL